MNVLIKFSHGLGDAVQLTCILAHLTVYRPDWTVDVASQIGKHSAFYEQCRRSFILGRDPIDERSYQRVFDLGWWECYSVYTDSPCTKVCNCLREDFGIVPDPALLRYRIEVSADARQVTRAYLAEVCRGRESGGRFPAVAIHYQGNTSPEKKNLPHELVAELCRRIIECGYVPIILDWDRRSPLPDQRTIFCPAVSQDDLWHGTGTGDAERLAALVDQCTLFIGVDSGPLHVAGATSTPALAVWTGLHPVQFFDLCPNVTHFVPEHWRNMPPAQNAPAARYFEKHYEFCEYRHLPNVLLPAVTSRLSSNREGESPSQKNRASRSPDLQSADF